MNFNAETSNIEISSNIRLRAEYFGGLVFDTSNGNLIEVDKDAFTLLSILGKHSVRYNNLLTLKFKKKSSEEIDAFLREMVALDVVTITERQNVRHQFFPDEIIKKKFKYAHLSAPETVHWAVTFRCDKHCPDCYTEKHRHNFTEMNTEAAFKLIDKISDWNVFQLAIGGGEPLERKDLAEIIKYAKEKGLMVHLTTGRTQINPQTLKLLSTSLTSIQLGLHTDNLLKNSDIYLQEIRGFSRNAENEGLRTGVNLILDTQSLSNFNRIIKQITDCGFKRIVLLRYKPPHDIKRWEERKPQKEQLINLHQQIADIQNKYPEVSFRFDCAFSFIQRNLSVKDAEKHGFKGCVAADRILSVAPDGNVYPCSQLVHNRFCAGNLLKEETDVMWNHSKQLKKYRNFRKKGEFVNSACGICLSKNFCGGCRVFAEDGFCEDPGCPEPKHRPLAELGKTGRRVDFANYLKECTEISVDGYMERYEVSQKRAMAEWINEEENEDYPKWLNNERSEINEINFD